jgi:putative membrane protein
MIRFFFNVLVHVIAAAIGLIVAAAVLDDMALDTSGFVIAVAIFAAVDAISQPLIVKVAWKYSPALSGSSALLATFVALVVTTIVSDGLRIDGAWTWVLATVIVWAAAMLAGVLRPITIFKKWLRPSPQQPAGPKVQTYG